MWTSDPVIGSELRVGSVFLSLILLSILLLPCLWTSTSGAYFVSSAEGIVVSKIAYLVNRSDMRTLGIDTTKYSPPVMYEERFGDDGESVQRIVIPTQYTDSTSWYQLEILGRGEYYLTVSRDTFLRYKLGQELRKPRFSSFWHPTNHYYTYRSYYRHYYPTGYWYGARTRGYYRSPYGSGYIGK